MVVSIVIEKSQIQYCCLILMGRDGRAMQNDATEVKRLIGVDREKGTGSSLGIPFDSEIIPSTQELCPFSYQ